MKKSNKDLDRASKFISLILRHHPEAIGITLDEHGWADVDELIKGVQRTRPFDREMLEEIVASDEKQRYSFSPDKRRIRANQGHSIPVDVELSIVEPPEYLYHGTGKKYVESIERAGLMPRGRLYVHLSGDRDTAVKVGSRHGEPVVYRVNSGRMKRDGYVFYRSVNGVWLIKAVPAEYLELQRKDDNSSGKGTKNDKGDKRSCDLCIQQRGQAGSICRAGGLCGV